MSNNIQTSSRERLGFDLHLIRYGSIFLLIVGTFGNIVSFFIFSYGTLRKSSTYYYLAILSLMDLLVLYSGLLDLFLNIEYGEASSLRNLHLITCRLHTFITYWSQHSSSWILSFISVDRAIATNYIKFARKFCTPHSAKYIVGIILFIMALFNCHELVFLRLHEINITNNNNNYTKISSFNLNMTTDESLISDEFNINNKLLKKRYIQTILFFCDKFQSNLLCLRKKRDLSNLNITIPIEIIKPKMFVKKCESVKGTKYDYFWDNVWEWIDVCLYALIPFTVMTIGTFFIVYRVYYQQRRVFRSRRSGVNNSMGATPNKAKSLFYLLFTLNLLYFILVSPVVFVTTVLFRNPDEEKAYPLVKSIVYLMQYCNHSLNFIFYGITSPPYRQTLYEWFQLIISHLPQCCQRIIRERSKSTQIQNNSNQTKLKRFNKKNSPNIELNGRIDRNIQKETISLVPR